MALLQDLINKIDDPTLRQRIMAEVGKLTKQKKFGLVFEEHLPECTPLYDVGIKVDSKVALKNGQVSDIYIVRSINGDKTVCEHQSDHAEAEFAIDELVAVAEFGEPIYPYLKPVDTVCNAPDSELWHTLIEADNYHALQLLEYLYAGKVDCIYIDPPYNTGARDWKYNNDYVDASDAYRHSKWLSMMEKRLKLAKKLLNPKDSVLIVTIDEKEYLHLGCLLEELFPEANMQMVSSVINRAGTGRKHEFSRTDEYLFFLRFGAADIAPDKTDTTSQPVTWDTLRRSGPNNTWNKTKKQFYPVFVDYTMKKVHSIGKPLVYGEDKIDNIISPEGCTAVFPIRDDGKEMMWGCVGEEFLKRLKHGYIRVGKATPDKPQKYVISYLTSGIISSIENGDAVIKKFLPDGSVDAYYNKDKEIPPTTNWQKPTHDAQWYGSNLLKQIIEPRFSYPKSLYAVRDSLDYCVRNKPNALIVDFFAGSGTTLHAVNLLNAEDGGHRRCIMVTNNEVAEDEANSLKAAGYQPGDEEWEKLGIARYVTWPRTKCSIYGIDINGNPLSGEYLTNIRKTVEYPRIVKQILLNASLLTTAARKSIVALFGKDNLPQSLVKSDSHYIISDKYTTSIIFDIEYIDDYMDELNENSHVTDIYIVTDNNTAFNKLKKEILELLGPVQKIEDVTLPMADGFKANAAYFKLGFLDKASVRIGRQFREMLPTLWMKAGCYGPCPSLEGQKVPMYMVLPENHMAILNDSSYYRQFAEEVQNASDIETVYLVTDSDADYRSMAKGMNVKQTYQLYRDYLDNFRINSRR